MEILDSIKDFIKSFAWGKWALAVIKYCCLGIMVTVIFCTMLQNGWLAYFGIDEPVDVSVAMYTKLQATLVSFSIAIGIFVNAVCDKYYVGKRYKFKVKSKLHPVDKAISDLNKEDKDDADLAAIIRHNAIHEAGHVVMAKRFGYSIMEAVIYPNPHIGINNKQWKCLDDIKHQAMIYFAGNCALKLLSQDFYPYYANFGDVDDFESAYECIKRYIVLEDNQFSYVDVYYEHHGVKERMEQLSKDWFAETENILNESIVELRGEAARLELFAPKGDV